MRLEQSSKAWRKDRRNQKLEEELRPSKLQATLIDKNNVSIGELNRLIITQILVKDHQLMLLWKTHKD